MSSPSSDSFRERARRLHFSSIVVDTHADTTQRLLDKGFDLGRPDVRGSIDIPRMKEGGLGAIFFSIWVPSSVRGPAAVRRGLAQIAAVRKQVRKHARDLALAKTAAEVRTARKKHKIAILLGIEGGHLIASDLSVLRKYAALGARYMTLTHSGNTEWADSSSDRSKHDGLTDFGRDVVREMNRLGMIVDVSHASDKAFYDALEVSSAPMIASHSSCRVLCDHPRNLTDMMMKALAAKGGVVQINFYVAFLSQKFRDATKKNAALIKKLETEVAQQYRDSEACQLIEGERRMRVLVAEGLLPRVGWQAIIAHIDHAVKVAGIDHVGLGSDFDGAGMPYGMEDASMLPKITGALLRKKYSEQDVRKILGQNTLRLMKQVEQVARRMS